MKVLLIHNSGTAKNIGGEDVVFDLERNYLLGRLGKSAVFTRTISNDRGSVLKIITNVFFSIPNFFAVYRLVKREKIDIVHVHNFFPLISPSVFFAGRLAGAKTIQTLHNYRWSCINGSYYRQNFGNCQICKNKTIPLSGIKYRCFRQNKVQSVLAQAAYSFFKLIGAVRKVDYFFALTPFQVTQLRGTKEFKNARIILKPNFIRSLSVKQSVEKSTDFIYVGRLDENKGFGLLVKAWEKLGNKYTLTVIGSGDMEPILLGKNCPVSIKYQGALANEEVKLQIARARYLIQASVNYETFGLTILEAFSNGVPVIGFEIGTRKDFIKDGINGFLAGGVDELTLKMQQAMSLSSEQYLELRKNAVDSYKRLQEDKVMDYPLQVYKNIINNETIGSNDFFQ